MTSSQINSDLLTAAAVAQLSQSGWSSLSEQWKACIADIVLGNLPEQFILQVSISICSILAQGRTLGFEYRQNLNQHILTDNSIEQKTESTINSPTIKSETSANPLIELPSARSAFATLVSSAQQNTISTPTSTTAMLLSNLVNNSATSPTTTTSDPKTSLLEQMGLIKSQNVKPEFQPTPTTTTTTTAASLTNQVLNLLKAAQDSNNGVIFNSNSNQEISLSNSLNNLTNSLNGNLNGSTINSFNHGVNNSNFNRVSGISPKKSKIAQNGLFQNGSNEDSHNEENYSENLQNSILNSIKNVTQNNTHSNTQNNTNAKNNSQYNVLNNSMNNTLNNAQSHTLNTTDSTKSDASNLRLISHLPSLLAENLSNFDKQESQNPLSPNTISNNIIDQINAGSLNSTSNLSNGSLNGNSQNSIPKTKNISNLKRPLENSKNFDWKNQEKPVAIRNPGESIMYECRWCDHKSRRRNDLEDHERRHMEKMNFGCHLCPYRAKQKFTMKHHMYKVHQTKFDASKMLVFD